MNFKNWPKTHSELLPTPSLNNSYTPKCQPHLKKSINRAHLENGTYKQIVTHLERELELNGLEAPDELQINTVSHNAANSNADRTKPMWHNCKKPGHYKNQCRLWKEQREQTGNTQNTPGNKNSEAKNSNPNNNVNNKNHNNYKNSNIAERKPETVYPPCEPCGNRTTPQRDFILEPMQQTGHFPGRANRKDRVDIINGTHRTV